MLTGRGVPETKSNGGWQESAVSEPESIRAASFQAWNVFMRLERAKTSTDAMQTKSRLHTTNSQQSARVGSVPLA